MGSEHAMHEIQVLRHRAASAGGWWPAPLVIKLQINVASQHISAHFHFEPHFMNNGRTCITWERPHAS